MKKSVLLLVITVYLFSCNSGNDLKTKTTAVEVTNLDTTKKEADTPPIPDLTKYIISKEIADAIMKHHPILPKTPDLIDSSLKIDLLNQNADATLESIKCKYRKEDEPRYCSTRGFLPGSDSSKVKNYKTVIYKLITQNMKKEATETYYDFVTLCPPPLGGCGKKKEIK